MIRLRYRRIVLFFARILLSFAFWDLVLPRLGLAQIAQRNRSARLQRSAAAFRTMAIEMGGVLIKVGQFLSSRVDILPPEIIAELSGLQDEVPPASFYEIRKVAETDLGTKLNEKFIQFEEKPFAAASLGQVYRAKIPVISTLQGAFPGEPTLEAQADSFNVVVKIQRPNIEVIIATDLAALRTVGNWLRRYRPISRRANVPALLDEFTRILYEEIDYLAEGRNAEMFSANFQDQPGVRVPQVIWTHTTKRVLTLENVLAIKITDYNQFYAAGIQRADVAARLLNTYLKQIFEDGFFHADPHPGNLFVSPVSLEHHNGPRPEDGWQLTFIDFGMVGHVPDNLRAGLREMLIGVGTQDAARVVRSYQALGFLLPGADLALIEKAEAKVFERFWGKDMTELMDIDIQEIRQFADEFRELIYMLPFQLPYDLILLARTVGILSGMCTGLDPRFNLWNHIAPYTQKLIEQESQAYGRETWLNELSSIIRSMVSVPKKIDTILGKMDRGEIVVRAPEVSQQVSQLEGALRQIAGGIIFTALLLGGIQFYLADQSPFGEILLGGAGISLAWTFLTGRRKRT